MDQVDLFAPLPAVGTAPPPVPVAPSPPPSPVVTDRPAVGAVDCVPAIQGEMRPDRVYAGDEAGWRPLGKCMGAAVIRQHGRMRAAVLYDIGPEPEKAKR